MTRTSRKKEFEIEDKKRLGSTIKFLRMWYDLTQKELSERSGVSKVAICQIERGSQAIQLYQLKCIANALELQREDIVMLSDRFSQKPPREFLELVKKILPQNQVMTESKRE